MNLYNNPNACSYLKDPLMIASKMPPKTVAKSHPYYLARTLGISKI